MSLSVRRLLLFPLLAIGCSALSGCLVVTAVDVAADTVKAGVGVTSAVVGGTVDVLTESKEEKEKKEKKANK